MTKAEERKILEQIVNLIQSTPIDSYIRSAFSGVPEYAVRNIDDDAAYNPVEERDMLEKKNAEMGQKLIKLEHENNALVCRLDNSGAEIEKLGHLLDSKTMECERIKEERDAMADCVNGNAEIIDKAEAEIRKLKAEIVRMRMATMTEEQVAELYDKTEGV